MSDENDTGDSKVTLKAGKGYDAPWYTPGGTPSEIRAQIIEFMGFEPSTVEGLSLAELVVNAATSWQAIYSVGATLGGAVMQVADGTPYAGPTGAAAWGDDKPVQQSAEKDPLIAALEAAATVGELGDLWVANKPAFDRPEVAAAAEAARKRIDGGGA